jgi:hypothetical protein
MSEVVLSSDRDNTDLLGILYSPGKYRIHFRFNGKISSAQFVVEEDSGILKINNKCIHIELKNSKDFASFIQKDDNVKKCFEPALNVRKMGNINVSKNTMTDALQILSTKIKLAVRPKIPIYIFDGATSNDISISQYRIIRGKDGIYEKYGYESDTINKIKDYIQKTTWSEFLKMGDIKRIIKYFQKNYPIVKEKLNPSEDTPLYEVFQHITLEDEKNLSNNYYDAPFSFIIFNRIKYELTGQDEFTDDKFVFNENSEQWEKIKNALLIIDVEPIAMGGRLRKTRKIQKNKK